MKIKIHTKQNTREITAQTAKKFNLKNGDKVDSLTFLMVVEFEIKQK